MNSKRKSRLSAKEFDEKFDRGEDISEYLDLENARRKIDIDAPEETIEELDKES